LIISNIWASSTNKTLVSWVVLNDKNIRGGSVLTIQEGNQYDGIILEDIGDGQWIAGNDKTHQIRNEIVKSNQKGVFSSKLVQIVAVYQDNEARIYLDGKLNNKYIALDRDLLKTENNFAVFGLNYFGGEEFMSCFIEDARIYDKALSLNELKELKPNKSSKIKPYAWWDFESETIVERMGRFVCHNLGEGEDVEIENGRLVLDQDGYLISTKQYNPETPVWPENPPESWPTYHLAHPGSGRAEPGDPNPAFYYKNRYHLHYIYNNLYGIAYAHVSSQDMVHWQWHPTVLIPPNTGHGMFSGTGFFTKEGQPAMIYHGVGSGKNYIVIAKDDNLDQWDKPVPVLAKDNSGKIVESVEYWDPDCWINNGLYYAISGGENPQMMKSSNLKNWKYMGDLLHSDYSGEPGIPRHEDISCANMFKIGNKWMLLCISHRLGCRYYLGDFKDKKYLPDFHALMNWINTDEEDESLIYFAPESVLAPDGRRVMWAWLITKASPTGIQSLPRELELPDDGILRIKPLSELEILRYDELSKSNVTIKSNNDYDLSEITGDAIELSVTFKAPFPKEFGINLLGDENGEDILRITAGANKKNLEIGSINPPFNLAKSENFTLRIFIDKSLVEVFANDRQAAAVSHSHIRKNPNISIFSNDIDLIVEEIKAWKMKSIYDGNTVFKSN
jgi:sucrose-6-phosphate hydrolase SacC (GH32 family)